MKYGLIGALMPKVLDNVVYAYTKKALPDVNIKQLKKRHGAEYKAMVRRTQSVGSLKENMLCATAYIACYGFAYYKADPTVITADMSLTNLYAFFVFFRPYFECKLFAFNILLIRQQNFL